MSPRQSFILKVKLENAFERVFAHGKWQIMPGVVVVEKIWSIKLTIAVGEGLEEQYEVQCFAKD